MKNVEVLKLGQQIRKTGGVSSTSATVHDYMHVRSSFSCYPRNYENGIGNCLIRDLIDEGRKHS